MTPNFGFTGGMNVALDPTTKDLFVYYATRTSAVLEVSLPLSLFLASELPDNSIPLVENDYFAIQYTYRPNNSPKQLVDFVLQESVFDFGAGRASVVAAFGDLMTKIEGVEGKYIQPGALPVLRAMLAFRTPAKFAESLQFNYSFVSNPDTKQAYIDLQPGMRLRMAPEVSQIIPDAPSGLGTGYVSTGESVIEVVSKTGPQGDVLGFDAFLSSLAVPAVSTATGGAGGLIDFRSTTFQRRHLRLCYPASFPPSDSAGSSDLRTAAALIGADTLAELNQATTTYYSSGSFGPNISTGFFRGRTVLIPEVMVYVNGNSIFVPVGTTCRDLLARYSLMPRFKGLDVVQFSNKYFRYIQDLSNAGGLNGVNQSFANVNPTNLADANDGNQDVYDFPVIAGDSVNVTNA